MKCGVTLAGGHLAECGVEHQTPDRHENGPDFPRFLTREQLAEVLQVSVRTVDAMGAAGEVPCLRLCGGLVRFYLPDVVRALTAKAVLRAGTTGLQTTDHKTEDEESEISDLKFQSREKAQKTQKG